MTASSATALLAVKYANPQNPRLRVLVRIGLRVQRCVLNIVVPDGKYVEKVALV